MGNKEANKTNKLHKPIMTAAIFLTIALGFYIAYLVVVLPNTILTWNFALTAADVLALAVFAVVTWLVAFDTKKLKLLAIPAFIQATVIVVTLALMYRDSGIAAQNTYYWFRYSTLAVALALFGLYSQDRDISIVYSCIVITISTAFSIWYNIEELVATIRISTYAAYYYLPLIELFTAIGLFVLVWMCCLYFPHEADKKDIIKKKIGLSVILSIVTLGIYAVYWVKIITEDIAKLEGSEVNSSQEAAMFFVVPFYALYWLYDKGRRTSKLADDANMSIIYVVQGVFMLCFFALALMQNQLHIAAGIKEK